MLLAFGCKKTEVINIDGERYVIKGSSEKGIGTSLYDDGKVKSTMEFVNGIPNGKNLVYYPSGKIKKDINYKNGSIDGTYKLYYTDGTLYEEGHCIMSKKDGEFKRYDAYNKISNISIYKNNDCISTTDYKNGKPTEYKLSAKKISQNMGVSTFYITVTPSLKNIKYFAVRDGKYYRISSENYSTTTEKAQNIEFIGQGVTPNGVSFSLKAKAK